jgi:hypothetical protein
MKIPETQSHGWNFLADSDDVNGNFYFWHKRSGMIVRVWSGSDGQICFRPPKCLSLKSIYADTDIMPSDHDSQMKEFIQKFEKGEGKTADIRAGKYGNWEVRLFWLQQAFMVAFTVLTSGVGFPVGGFRSVQARRPGRQRLRPRASD